MTQSSRTASKLSLRLKSKSPISCASRSNSMVGGDWANIDADVLECIHKNLPLADVLRCRGVCTWWRSVTKTHLSISINSLPKPYPPLIIWERYIVDNLYLPNTKSKELLAQMGHCVGSSSSGFFLFKDGESGNTLYLFHPMLFSGSALHLPLSTSGDPSFLKGVLWGDPISHSSYGVVVLHHGYRPPLFAKCGAAKFTPLEYRARDDFIDIICVKNHIYGITKSFNFNVWDCTTCIGSGSSSLIPRLVSDIEPKFSTLHPPTRSTRDELYLMEYEGEILLVVIDRPNKRRLDYKGGLTGYNKVLPIIQVYKMHFNNKEWARISSLGDRVLFVTDYQSMSISSHQFPQYQRNSIYYWHYIPAVSKHTSLGIFNMEDGSLKLID